MPPTRRETVDLSGFPDLVVIYLGMRPRSLRGIRTLLQLGPQIAKAGAERPVGLCCTRTSSSRWCRRTSDAQYWRDFDSLERWTRTLPHKRWWQEFLRESAEGVRTSSGIRQGGEHAPFR